MHRHTHTFTHIHTHSYTHTYTHTHIQESRSVPIGEELIDVNSDTFSGNKVKLVFKISLLAASTYILPVQFYVRIYMKLNI